VKSARSAPSEYELRLGDVSGELTVAKVIVRRLRQTRVSLRRRVGERAVQLGHTRHRRIGFKIADDGKNGIRRSVEILVKTDERVAGELAQARLVTNAPAANAVHVVYQCVE